MTNPHRIILGVTGASGVIYAERVIPMLDSLGVECHLVATKAAELTLKYERNSSVSALAERAHAKYAIADIGAPIASGSFQTAGMLIAPCSIKTMSEIATGVTSNLLSRAADVTLKERRRLVLMVRETPLHLGHLRSMTALTEMGAVIAPPAPAFYAEPQTIEEMVDQSLARMIDLFDLPSPPAKRWGEDLTKGRRGA